MYNILTISRPEDLFPGDLDEAKKKYHALAVEWHPDTGKHPDSSRIFQHINSLYREAVSRIENDRWEGSGILKTPRGDLYYLMSFAFELGRTYVGSGHVTYMIDRKHEDLYNNGLSALSGFRFADTDMRKEYSRFLPVNYMAFETSNKFGLKIEKGSDFLLLRDILRYSGGKLDPRHVAWILSSVHNLCCYFQFQGIVHHDISMDTYFISPSQHNGMLLGGWWYSHGAGDQISVVPTRTATYLPWEARQKKIALQASDMELLRALGRELLGDASGSTLTEPKAMAQWLKDVAGENPVANYKEWRQVLASSFGPRKFTEMPISEALLYPPMK